MSSCIGAARPGLRTRHHRTNEQPIPKITQTCFNFMFRKPKSLRRALSLHSRTTRSNNNKQQIHQCSNERANNNPIPTCAAAVALVQTASLPHLQPLNELTKESFRRPKSKSLLNHNFRPQMTCTKISLLLTTSLE